MRPDTDGGKVASGSVRTEPSRMSMHVPCAATSVSRVRRSLNAWLDQVGVAGEVADDARVVISELVANSVRHAQPLADGTVLVEWSLDREGLRMSVTDGGGTNRPHIVDAPASAVSGRGMAIVETLVDKWWQERTRTRSTVHTVMALG